MKLILPSPADEAAVMDFRQEFLWHGEYPRGCGGLERYDHYAYWLARMEDVRHGRGLAPGLPPSSIFLCYVDDQLVGMVNIRHQLSDFLLQYGGHVGFCIRQSCRGRNLGARMLTLALEECRRLNISRVLVVCSRHNPYACAVIETIGGVLENETAYEGDIRRRYWIENSGAYLRPLAADELCRDLFAGFDRRQEVTLCRRRIGVSWRMVSCPFVDDWTEEQLAHQIRGLQATIRGGGAVFGAFSDGVLKGFAAVEGRPMGPGDIYRDLTSLHVSADCRGQGLGKALFAMAAQWARENGAQKLYISAHSAMETQAFYTAMGCVDTLWPSPEHVALEPFDCQLEYTL